MSIPGFTAEASLYNVSARYRATAEAAVYGGGLVQPALSDQIELYPRLWCLTWNCDLYDPVRGKPICVRTLGIWNHVTSRCERL